MVEHQIDFLAIGEKDCGEAIALRFGNLESGDTEQQTVILIDGGFKSSAAKVREHILEHFGTDVINLVISTHDDRDHIGGLPEIIKTMTVQELWMLQPWEHSGEILAARQSDFAYIVSKKHLQASLQAASDLMAAADEANLTPKEVFAGYQASNQYGAVTVLSPSLEYYEQLLAATDLEGGATNAADTGVLKLLKQLANKVANIPENLNLETLTDRGNTSTSNNTSIVVLLELATGKKFLFCGDAGIQALDNAADLYHSHGHLPGQLELMQVPHHGSKRNVGPTVLNKFLGEPTKDESMFRGHSVVSVGTECTRHLHPHKVVANAFKRRGYPMSQTRDGGKKHGFHREGWGPSEPLPMFGMVESDG